MKLKLGFLNQGINTGSIGGGGGAASPPAQPTGLSATPITTSRIDLAWTDAATDETAYKVYRSTNGTDYTQVGGDLAAGTQAYSDTTITAGTKYYYKVAAVNAAGETLSAAATANTLTLTLISYWKMDETSDGSGAVTRNDSHGTNHLTDNGTTPSTTGIINNGISCTAANAEYMSRASNASLQSGATSFTFSLWFRFTALGAIRGLIWKLGEYDLYYDNGPGQVRFVSAGGVRDIVVPSINTTYHLIVYRDLANQTIGSRLNGAAAVTTAAVNTITVNANEFDIGNRNTAYMSGWIDEVVYWKRLLTTEEGNAIYNAGAGFQYPF